MDHQEKGKDLRIERQKKRLQDTMKTILSAYELLKMQWSGKWTEKGKVPGHGLGQSPDNGIKVLKKVKACYPDVPFVFYSAKITPEDVINILQAGATDAIRKRVVEGKDLLKRLERALKKKIYES